MPNESPDPIFISVKQAAEMLSITPWWTYQLCESGQIESRYIGRRRVVSVASLREYAEGLPATKAEKDATA